MPNTALIFGASGITGWAIAKAALEYPTPTTFDKVIALTNRPLSKQDAYLPDDSRLALYSGIDLSSGVDKLVGDLKKIDGIEGVTHVYFTAYTSHQQESGEVKRANVEILVNSVKAVEQLAPNLKFWTLQTGGKAYGVEFPDKIEFNTPFKESLPRIAQPYYEHIFYYAQYDALAKLAGGKKWRFVEVRPDAIIGFVPRGNPMNIAQQLAIFLSLYKFVEGEGAEVPFPGGEAAYTATHSDTNQDILAHFHIFASFHSDVDNSIHSKSFNVADGDTVTWETKWGPLCQYFGLKGVGPGTSKKSTGVKWFNEHKDQWQSWIEKHGLRPGAIEGTDWQFADFILVNGTFNREYDLSASRAVGFDERIDTVQGYYTSFDRTRAANIIP